MSVAETRGNSAADYDMFVDLSAAPLSRDQITEYVEELIYDAAMGASAGAITIGLPEERDFVRQQGTLRLVGADQVRYGLWKAIRRAAAAGRHLAIVLGPLVPDTAVLRRLVEEFERDPLFGAVHPRFADSDSDRIWALPGDSGTQDTAPLSRAGLARTAAYMIVPEMISACMMVRREAVREMDHSELPFAGTVGELLLLLCQARRRGYRNVVVNRAVIASELTDAEVYPRATDADLENIYRLYPESERAGRWIARSPERKLEALLARAYAGGVEERGRILLDCRGMAAVHNGTSHNIIGLLDGTDALETPWQFDVRVSSAAAKYFRLAKRYQKFKVIVDAEPVGTYAAAILLNQPWALATVEELHRCALVIGFNMLDTIAWDILYSPAETVDGVWRFIARHADVLFFNSQFTRERFNTRFPVCRGVAERVLYLSMAVEEQVDEAAAREPLGDYILVIGNDYDHKDVRRTVQTLAHAFPLDKKVALGISASDEDAMADVEAMPSGHIEEASVQRLMAGARVIVFPSFYEGFGIPVVQGMAYGRTVVARESPLWHELAGRLRTPGQLVTYDSASSLVEAVGCALAGRPPIGLAQGTALRDDENPLRWKDCARGIIHGVEDVLSRMDTELWREREEALEHLPALR